MPANIRADQNSVYLAADVIGRSNMGLYRSVRELVGEYSQTGSILDVGCSDGIATIGLEGVTICGLDINEGALRAARAHNPGFIAIRGDIRRPPFPATGLGDIDTVLALDILEHEKRADTLSFLQGLRADLRPEHTIIASMPIVSLLTVDSLREGILAVRRRERPETGLFDRTHQILRGQRAHRKLFKDAGYAVVEEYRTNHFTDVTGDWKWQQAADANLYDPEAWLAVVTKDSRLEAPTKAVYRYAKELYDDAQNGHHPLGRKIMEAVTAYQGLYVLKPKV